MPLNGVGDVCNASSLVQVVISCQAQPLLEGGIGRWPPSIPLSLAILPVRPSALGAEIANSVERESIEPTFSPRKAEDVIVNPLMEAEAKEPWFVQKRFILDETRTVFSQSCRKQ